MRRVICWLVGHNWINRGWRYCTSEIRICGCRRCGAVKFGEKPEPASVIHLGREGRNFDSEARKAMDVLKAREDADRIMVGLP